MTVINITTDVIMVRGGIPRVFSVEVSCTDLIGASDLVAKLEGICENLNRGNLLPYAPTFGGKVGQPIPTPEPKPDINPDAVEAPFCPDHGSKMSTSSVQRKAGEETYYCTRRTDGEYCKRRAAVKLKDGKVKRWEVK